jgi:lipoyl-dependent peroxiredoxin
LGIFTQVKILFLARLQVCIVKTTTTLNKRNMKRSATAVWNGNIKEGKGVITSQSTVLNKTQYSVASRFEDGVLKHSGQPSTNPEELMAAAHAGCFTMKLTLLLSTAGFNPASIETTCTITLDPKVAAITQSALKLKARIAGITKERFAEITQDAKANCPVSKAYANNMEITLDAELVG